MISVIPDFMVGPVDYEYERTLPVGDVDYIKEGVKHGLVRSRLFKNEEISKLIFTANNPRTEVNRCVFIKCKFDDLRFDHALSFGGCIFIDCIFDTLKFYELLISECYFVNCTINNINKDRACILNSAFHATIFERVNFDDSKYKYVILNGCSFRFSNVSDQRRFEYCNFFNSEFVYGTEGFDKVVPTACPEEGGFIAWKYVEQSLHSVEPEGYIVKLYIPADAKRSSATTNKCRASKALVLDIQNSDGKSSHRYEVISDRNFTYKIGELVKPDLFDEYRLNECSNGIHFFMNRADAVAYGFWWEVGI